MWTSKEISKTKLKLNFKNLSEEAQNNCGDCDERFVNDNAVFCEGGCDRWFHPPCGNVGKATFESLIADQNQCWECHKFVCKAESHNEDITPAIIRANLPLPAEYQITPEISAFRQQINTVYE